MSRQQSSFGWFSETGRALASIKSGMVTYVNPATHVYDVITDDGCQYPSIALMSPYVNHFNGQGYTAVAREQSRCIIGVCENREAFIMGFIVPVGLKPSSTLNALQNGSTQAEANEAAQRVSSSYEGRSGNRPQDAMVDDQEIKGPKGNYIGIRASGAIEIVSDDGLLLTRWISNPGENVIISVAEMIENILPCGEFVWKTDYKENIGYLKATIKSSLDRDADISIKMGQMPDDDPDKDNRVTISVTPNGSSKSVKISITASGEVKVESENLTIDTKSTIKVNCQKAEIKAKSRVKISGSSIELV